MKQLRIVIGLLVVVLLLLASLNGYHLTVFEKILTDSVLQGLSTTVRQQARQIDHYVAERIADARTHASQPDVRHALSKPWRQRREKIPNALPQAALDHLNAIREHSSYHDMLLIDAEGNVLYSLRGEPDWHGNLLRGPYRDSGLANAFRQAMSTLHVGEIRFDPYLPTAGRVAAFVVAPVIDEGKALGALAMQINLADLELSFNGQGEEGSAHELTVAVKDGVMVRYASPPAAWSESPFARDIPLAQVASPMQRALMGEKGSGVIDDGKGRPVAASWDFLPSLGFGIVVETDANNALSLLHRQERMVQLLLLGILAIFVATALLFRRSLIHSEAAIATEKIRHQAMIEGMNDGILVLRPEAGGKDFTVVDLNPAAERISSVRREEVIGQRLTQVYPGLEAAGILAAFHRVAASGGSEMTEMAYYHDDRGHPGQWIENDLISLPGGEILAVFRDISVRKHAEDALAHSLANLNEAQRVARLGSWRYEAKINRMHWSEEIFRILELDPHRHQASQETYFAAVHPDERESVRHTCMDMLQRPGERQLLHRLLFSDGRIKFVRARIETRFSADGATLSTHGTVQDVTEFQQTREALELYASVFQNSGEALIVTDHNNRIIAVNPSFVRQTEYPPEEVLGRNPRLLSSGLTPLETYQEMWAGLKQNGYWQGELWDRSRTGRVFPKWAAISSIRNEQGVVTHYMAGFTDISKHKSADERLNQLTHYDTLTGLFNRYDLEIRLAQALLSARREKQVLALLFIDLDHFKVINDTLGHQIGDLLLIEAAHRLRTCIRESDIAARQGGDEFVIVANALHLPVDASPIANKILRALAEPYDIGGHRLHTSPSIGIAIFPNDGDDAATLMKHADAAMYHAKEQGRNNAQYFTAQLNAMAAERLTMERELRVAIAARQFELYYQPQFAADADAFEKPAAVEALIRWRHPERGMIPPDRFIPVAEDNGLILAIGDWALREACKQLAQWKRDGIGPRRVAVNLSARQLRAADLVEQVAGILAHYQLEEGELELEITESAAMSNPAQALTQLEALRELGVTLAIDDFGTGYSSLAYLKRLPVQVLKLDRAFVRDIETDENDAAISTATLALAHNLGLKVVAEGIETEGQSRFLRAHGCDLLQGYLYGRPEPAATLSARWRGGS